MRKSIVSPKGAPPIGPYSPAMVADGPLLFVSGQGATDPATGKLRPGGIREQAEQVFENIGALLEAAGASWEHVVKVGVFLANMADFAEMNAVYQQYVVVPYPARTTVQAVLPGAGMLIEVDCIAQAPQS